MDSLRRLYSNFGHRCSGGLQGHTEHHHIPENSMQAIKACLTPNDSGKILQYDDAFLYLEFDIRETKDHAIVVHHDATLFPRTMDASSKHNQAILRILHEHFMQMTPPTFPSYDKMIKKISVRDLTLEQLRSLHLVVPRKSDHPVISLPAVIAVRNSNDTSQSDSTTLSDDTDEWSIGLMKPQNKDDHIFEMETMRVCNISPDAQYHYVKNNNEASVMTLEEALNACIRWDLKRPLMVDMKDLYSDIARHQLLHLLNNYICQRKSQANFKIIMSPMYQNIPVSIGGVGLLAFPMAFCTTFGVPGTKKWRYWSKLIYEAGLIGVRLPGVHFINLCSVHNHHSRVLDDSHLDNGLMAIK